MNTEPASPADCERRTSSVRRAGVVLALLVVVVAGGLLVARGSARALGIGPWDPGNYDWALIYGSARGWLVNGDPYTAGSVSRAWAEAAGPAERDPMQFRQQAVLVYPAPAFPVLAAWAVLPWPAAEWAWTLTNSLLAVGVAIVVPGLAGLSLRSAPGLIVAAAALAYAPVLTSVAHGQTAVLVCGLVILAQWATREERSLLAGVMLGLAACVKPQVALLFVAHEVYRRRWRSSLAAVGVMLMMVSIGAGRMVIAGVDPLGAWRANLSGFTGIDDANPTIANPTRHHLINLHYPLHTFTDERTLVSALVIAIVGGLGLAYLIADVRHARRTGGSLLPPTRWQGPGELVPISMVAVGTLAVVYHRAYDAIVLLPALAWGVATMVDRGRAWRERALGLAAALLASAFLVPGASALQTLAQRGHVPGSIVNSGLWVHVVQPHAAWAIVALGVVLIAARWTQTPTDNARSTTRAGST